MRIDSHSDALIIVDLQPDFMPGGALAVAEGDRVAAPIARLAHRFSTVIATQDWHPAGHVSFVERGGPWPIHCRAGSPGAALHEVLPDELVTSILRKGTRLDVDSYSAFAENDGTSTGLGAFLRARGVSRVFVCGLARDFCVRATAVDGAAEKLEVYVLDDLTRAVDPTSRARVDAELTSHGVRVIDSGVLQ